MFIKHGEGKITSIVDVVKLTEEQKKAFDELSKKKTSEEDNTDSSKKLGS